MSLMHLVGAEAEYSLALEIREFLQSIKDEGTAIDSGGGLGSADLWVKIQGDEYYISISKRPKA
jgi:hypothetical protein